MRRALDMLTEKPCPVCLQLAADGVIQGRAVMPLPQFPALTRDGGEKCCRDCAIADGLRSLGGHPEFAPSRLTVANERCAGFTMPKGIMEHFGLCAHGYVEPCSMEDLEQHAKWLAAHGIPDSASCDPFESPTV